MNIFLLVEKKMFVPICNLQSRTAFGEDKGDQTQVVGQEGKVNEDIKCKK